MVGSKHYANIVLMNIINLQMNIGNDSLFIDKKANQQDEIKE